MRYPDLIARIQDILAEPHLDSTYAAFRASISDAAVQKIFDLSLDYVLEEEPEYLAVLPAEVAAAPDDLTRAICGFFLALEYAPDDFGRRGVWVERPDTYAHHMDWAAMEAYGRLAIALAEADASPRRRLQQIRFDWSLA